MQDFRKNDPNFIGFTPSTAGEAVDLFHRLKRLGLRPEHFPEAFVWCTRELDDEQGAMFEEYLVAPQGVSMTTAVMEAVDPEQEKIRLKLLAQAERRDLDDAMRLARIDEEDDEKVPQQISPLEEEQGTMDDPAPLVFEMDDIMTDAPPDDEMVLASPR